MIKLKQCPCGQVPLSLFIVGDCSDDKNPKWARCYADCCGCWEIEYRNGYVDIESDEGMRLAIEAWNSQPRWNDPQPQAAEVLWGEEMSEYDEDSNSRF